MRLILASNNAKKLSELRALFDGLPLDLQPQGAFGIPEAEEPHLTFVENALAKARHGDQMPSMLSFITGPSRTGDIERILVLGAHGPKELYLVLVG